MEQLNSVEEIDTVVSRNPNSVVLIYADGCPWCERVRRDLENLEKKGLVKVYLLREDKGAGLVKNLGAEGVPLTISFKECELTHIYEGYDESIARVLEREYMNAKPVCRVDISEVLFEDTLLGEPLI